MSWVFSIAGSNGRTLTKTVRSPEFSDITRLSRAQRRGLTDGGLVFVQDLVTRVQLVEGAWTWLTPTERGDLEEFFGSGGSLRQSRKFSISISGTHSYPQVIHAGMVVGGATVQAGVYKAGQFVTPDTATLNNVRLDQADLAFTQERTDRFSLSLRFRIENP